jgi:hypothetical protein
MADEARSILDSLMGGDRNALLPPGTAVPRPKKRNNSSHNGTSSSSSQQPLTLPTKRSKSCYDADVDPLYCAWGVNVYELFVNTKSDLGVANPHVPDDGARAEYLSLPKHEQERLGFEFMLFCKLQDLVRQCDRVVSRNKEKLEQEIQRNAAKNKNATGGGARVSDFYVQDIDEGAIMQLAQCQLRLDAVEKEVLQILETMEGHVDNQRQLESKINEVNVKLDEMEDKVRSEQDSPIASEGETNVIVKSEGDVVPKAEDGDMLHDQTVADNSVVVSVDPVKHEADLALDVPVKLEPDVATVKLEPDVFQIKLEADADTDMVENASKSGGATGESADGINPTDLELLRLEMEQLTKELADVILKKQRSQFDLARKIQQYAPLQESAEQQRKHLHFVKSDITMDKTVCEVSGNFMSARDADERIAAHYAGKQYVGWKLVRDKFKEMQQQYGRYGPPRPQRRDDGPGGGRHGGPVPSGAGRPEDRYAGRGGGFNNNRGPPVPARGGGGSYGGGRDYDRGGGRDRGGHPGVGGGYGRGGGGGYDRDRRDGGGRWGR